MGLELEDLEIEKLSILFHFPEPPVAHSIRKNIEQHVIN